MGNKGVKADQDLLEFAKHNNLVPPTNNEAKTDLAECLESLSDLAITGTNNLAVPEAISRKHSASPDISSSAPSTSRRRSFVKFLRSSASVDSSDDTLRKQLELLDKYEHQGDDGDWAEMRSWLVWCMRNSLEDEEMNLSDVAIPHPVLKSGRATRHLSLPRGSRKLRHQKAFDEEKDGVISAQSSLESNT